MEHHITDILIIGSGGAGLRAALAAKETSPDLRVTIVTSGQPENDSLTANACSDRMAFHVAFEHTPPCGDDAWRKHAEDIFIGGGQVSDPNLAILLALKAKDAFAYLDKFGVPWVRTSDGKPEQFRTDGSEFPRACYTGPYTARDIHHALLNESKRQGIEFISNHRLLGLVKPDNKLPKWTSFCTGTSTGEIKTIISHSVILATGGPGALFGSCLYPEGADAIPFFSALAAGAKLVNLEFIQFGLVNPPSKLACSGSLMRAIPNVVDQDDNDLFSNIDTPVLNPTDTANPYASALFQKGASWPVSVESDALTVDTSIWWITSKGRKVHLDFRRNLPAFNREVFDQINHAFWQGSDPLKYAPTPIGRLTKDNPQVIEWFTERGIDLSSEPIEIRHEAQHFQGGILINTYAETGVPGLFACGECAGGQHGANRPGGNSLMDCQVMGAIAGTNAAGYASHTNQEHVTDPSAQDRLSDITGAFSEKRGLGPDEINSMIVHVLKAEMGVVRTHDGLLNARRGIDMISLRGISWSKNEMHKMLAAISAISVSKAMVSSAWLRSESRGSHICEPQGPGTDAYARDPQFDGNWLVTSLTDDNEIQVDRTAIPELRKIK